MPALLGATALLVLVGAVGGCSSGSGTAQPVPAVSEESVSEPEPAAEGVERQKSTDDERVELDGTTQLDDAIAGLGSSYTFESTATTSSGDEILVVGRHLDGNADYTVTASGVAVRTVVVDGVAWVFDEVAAEWVQSAEVGVSDPLDALRSPDAVEVAPGGSLELVYPGGALGLSTDTVPVLLTFGADSALVFEYQTVSAHVLTELRPSSDASPISVPDRAAP